MSGELVSGELAGPIAIGMICYLLTTHHSNCQVLALVMQRCFAGNAFKYGMEAGKVVKAAFIANLLYAGVVFN